MDAIPGRDLPRTTPEAVGVSAASIGRFLDGVAAAGLELHSIMLARHGRVVAEGWWAPYRRDLPHMQHSLTKSFTATGIGLAVAEGLLALDTPVVEFFPDFAPAQPSPFLAAMTVRHLLTMTTGHRVGIGGDAWRRIRTPWIAEFFAAPVVEPPGTRFVYSSASSYMLSAILQRVSGERLHDYLDARLFRPLGIEGATWDVCPNGINPGGNGLSCRTEDLLKLGLLHLAGGVWDGTQVLPEAWARQATRTHVAVPDNPDRRRLDPGGPATPRGYGYQWWTGPDGAYYASGLFGQYAIVLPARQAVVAFTSAIPPEDSRLLDLVWRDLAPSLLVEDLSPRLRHLGLALPAPGPQSPSAQPVSGHWFRMSPNDDGVEAVMLRFEGDICVFTLRDARGEHSLSAGLRAWQEGWTTMSGAPLHHQYQPDRLRVSAACGWPDAQTFEMTWVFTETAFRDRVVCRFDGDRIAIDRSVNVNSAATTRPTLLGVRV